MSCKTMSLSSISLKTTSLKTGVTALVLALTLAAPVGAQAFTGVGGCSGLPEYYRAVGALQGGMESACAMTAAEARHILLNYGGVPGEAQPAVPPPAHHRSRRTVR
jgi:hypothetical protein